MIGTRLDMEVRGLRCRFHAPKALTQKFHNGEEIAQYLPPANPQPVFVVDDYKDVPENWIHGSGLSSSYFCPIEEGEGMWLDFTGNNGYNHDVAVVVSIQGINPITGQKTDVIKMEKYTTHCPIHDSEFGHGRYCEDCGFKWPAQNYISTTTGKPLWIDGFRTEDGSVRQYFFTEEEAKGVASQIIGEDKVYAIGIAFYVSKKPKERFVERIGVGPFGASDYTFTSMGFEDTGISLCGASPVSDITISWDASENQKTSETLSLNLIEKGLEETSEEEALRNFEVGAGALISQDLGDDPKDLDYWEKEPHGFLYINYANTKFIEKILRGGKKERNKEGFLKGLRIGK